MGQGIFQLVIIHTQYYSSQKYCAIFAVKVVELMRSMSTYTKRRNYNVCKTNTEKKMYNHAYSMNANDLTSMSMQGHCESIQRPFRSPDSKDFLNIATTQKKVEAKQYKQYENVQPHKTLYRIKLPWAQ